MGAARLLEMALEQNRRADAVEFSDSVAQYTTA
jgi:hypothetical protein